MDNIPLEKIVDVEMPIALGVYRLHLFEEKIEGGSVKEHLALVMGEIRDKTSVLTRIHSECCTGDVFGCQRCDCQDQLQEALRMIRRANEGVLLYLRQEGRGIGLANKLHAYNLQDQGLDTAEANEQLGFDADERRYEVAAKILAELRVQSVRLLTNNTNKVQGLVGAGIPVEERVPLVLHSAIRDRISLFRTKQEKLGHVFDDLDQTGILNASATNEKLPLSHPSLFVADVPMPQETLEMCDTIKQECEEKFKDNLSAVLFQGANMRGDATPHENDYDYILILKNESDEVLEGISELKVRHSKCNFLFVTENEYSSYPDTMKLQFFISRRVSGEFDLGFPPGRAALFQTALTYAVQINHAIRPLLFEFLSKNADKETLVDRAHSCLKRIDDCFLRVLVLLKTGKYPLNRVQLLAMTTEEDAEKILNTLNRWYSGTVTMVEVHETLKTSERLLHRYISQSPSS